MHRARDLRQPLRPVIDRVHRRDHRQQHLRGADVRSRLLAADMLLAGLQRQPIGRLPARIDRQPDDAAGQRALQRIAHRHIGGVRPAISHRHAKALRRTDRDIGAEFARRGQQRQRQQIGGDDRQRALCRATPQSAGRRSRTAPDVPGYCSSAPNTSAVFEIGEGIADHQTPAQRLGAGAQHRQRLRMHLAVDEERFGLELRRALRQRHRFGRSGGLVEQRRVGDVEPGEVADHGLEIEQRFQPALADLRLIRRVGGVPRRIFQDVALDHRRQDGAGIALADQRGEHLVLRGERRSYAPALRSRLRASRDRAAVAAGSTTAASRPSARRGFSRRRCPASRRYRAARGRYGGARMWWRVRGVWCVVMLVLVYVACHAPRKRGIQ